MNRLYDRCREALCLQRRKGRTENSIRAAEFAQEFAGQARTEA